MAATGKTPILLYGSTTATNQPSAGNLTNSSDGCEIAINVADKNLFFKDSTNAVNTVPIRQSSASSNGWLSSTDWSTFNGKQTALVSGTNIKTVSGTSLLGSGDLGTVGTGYGGTGLTSFTSGGVLYANSTSSLSTSTNLTFNNSTGQLIVSGGANSIYAVSTDVRAIAVAASSTGSEIGFSGGDQTNGEYGRYTMLPDTAAGGLAGILKFSCRGPGGAMNERARIFSGGGFCIGNTTNPGAGNLSVSGNVVIATSGKGIDFSATAGTGTSELLADYEEGTWSPGQGSGLTVVGSFSSVGYYTKIGNMVFVRGTITATTSIAFSAGTQVTYGLPYASTSDAVGSIAGALYTQYTGLRAITSSLYAVEGQTAQTSYAFSITYQV